AAAAVEIGIERRIVLVARMVISAGGVTLPDLDHGVGHGPAILVEHAAMDDDALAERLARALPGEVVLQRVEALAGEQRPGDLRQRLRQRDRRLRGCAQWRRLVFR